MKDYAGVEAEFDRLKARFESGALSEADFKVRLEELMVEDEQGRWWMIGYETGRWYVHDGEEWVPQEPPPSRERRPAPAGLREAAAPTNEAWARVRRQLDVASNRQLLASFSIPIITFLINVVAVNGLYGDYCLWYPERFHCPDWIHLFLAAAMPAVFPVALARLRVSPDGLARCLQFTGIVMSLYWIGAPIILLQMGGLSGGAEEIYGPSVLVLLGAAILSPLYAWIVRGRPKRQAG
jgi:hypothetical protein